MDDIERLKTDLEAMKNMLNEDDQAPRGLGRGKLKEPHICHLPTRRNTRSYQVQIRRLGCNRQRNFFTLQEAIEYRDSVLLETNQLNKYMRKYHEN